LLKVRQRENSFHAVLDTVPYCVSYQLTSGVIEQSLFASLQAEAADPELAASLSNIFGWEIDFFTDIRAGDDFTILYEKKKYGDGSEVLGSILAARITTSGEDHYAFGYKAKNRPWGYYDVRGASLEKSLLRAPLKYTRITSGFKRSRFHPVLHHYAPHLGVDYAAPYGTPVRATGDGTVVTAARNRTNGRYVKIRHNRTYTTYYLHLSRFAKGIRKGRKVKQGQVIGYVGSTGLATGPHLDYRIKRNNRFVNPRTIRLPSKAPVPDTEIPFFNRIRDACLVRFCEGSCGQGEKAKTVSVEKPFYHDPAAIPGLF
jgi:murein DD-endopeptidase MepM/ murein hydrolase activator NlpD